MSQTSTITVTNEGGNFEQVPAGNHVARCYMMVHIGTVEDEWQGKKVMRNKVRLHFELPNETRVFKEGEPAKPFTISRVFTMNLSDRSNLRKFLDAWRGKALTEEEAKSFELTKLIGVPCMLNVIHENKEGGKTYANITGAAPVPKGLAVPPQVHASIIFGYNPFNKAIFDLLPDFVKNQIILSEEYKSIMNPGHVEVNQPVSNNPSTYTPGAEDDLPF